MMWYRVYMKTVHTDFWCHWRTQLPVRGVGHGQTSCPWHPRTRETHRF